MKNRKNNKKGFTIVELVIVIAVIGILTAVLVPTFINLTQRANEASDQSLVKNLNTMLTMKHAEDNNFNPDHPTDVFDFLKTKGYLGEVLIKDQKSGKEILWNQPTDRFLFAEDVSKAEFASSKPKDFWAFSKTSATNPNGYSVYLYEEFEYNSETRPVLSIASGLDTGENDEALNLKYSNTGEAQTVTIRTNSADMTITVDDPEDTINHHGLTGEAYIDRTADGSYHEFGIAGYVQLASGRVVAEKGGKIQTVILTEKGEGATLNAIIESKGGEFINKFATRESIASLNNADNLSVKLVLVSQDPDNHEILITDAEAALLTPEQIIEALNTIISGERASAIHEVTPVPPVVHDLTEEDLAKKAEGYVIVKNGVYEKTFPEFLVMATANIKLLDNVSTSAEGFGLLGGSNVDLDLNGYSLTLKGEMLMPKGNTLTIRDSSGESGIWANNTENYGYGLIGVDGTLNIYGGKFDATGFDGACIGFLGKDGVVNIYGGKFIANAGYACVANLSGINIYGGTFDATAAGSSVFNFAQATRQVDVSRATIVQGSPIYKA